MSTIRVTKKQIVHALRTEPLKPNKWVNSPDGDWNFISAFGKLPSKSCTVCAVGSFLRDRICENEDISFFDVNNKISNLVFQALDNDKQFLGPDVKRYSPKNLIKQKKYLSALSTLFERYNPDRPIRKSYRERMVRFVEENFPNVLVLDTKKKKKY